VAADPPPLGIYCETVLTPGIVDVNPFAVFKALLTVLFTEPKALFRAPPALVGFRIILIGKDTTSFAVPNKSLKKLIIYNNN
jgi:hypothetical protein